MINLPLDYIKKMRELLGQDYDAFISSYEKEKHQGFRIDPLKIDPLDFVSKFSSYFDFELRNIPWCSTGYYYPTDQTISKLSLYQAGLYYLQEPSAMSPVELLDVRPGMKVLDLCAAPGGKSLQIAGKLRQQGLLISNDISLKRTKAILKNIEIGGVTNCIITNAEPIQLAERFACFFDRILVDAPCSGEGMFRKDPDLIKAYHEISKNIQPIQLEIMDHASKMLRNGGRLIYSTCTFNKEENEEVIRKFLEDHPDFVVQDPFALYPEIRLMGFISGYGIPSARLYPHKLEGEGHFIAIIERRSSQESSDRSSEYPIDLSDTFRSDGSKGSVSIRSDFQRSKKGSKKTGQAFGKKEDPATDPRSSLARFEEEMLYSPIKGEVTISHGSFYKECGFQDRLMGIRVIRNGLYLGDVVKGTFIPSSAFLSASKGSDLRHKISFPPDDPILYKYLRCETIHIDLPDGYHVVCVDDYPLGLIKVKNGTAKNLYNQNWRIL